MPRMPKGFVALNTERVRLHLKAVQEGLSPAEGKQLQYLMRESDRIVVEGGLSQGFSWMGGRMAAVYLEKNTRRIELIGRNVYDNDLNEDEKAEYEFLQNTWIGIMQWPWGAEFRRIQIPFFRESMKKMKAFQEEIAQAESLIAKYEENE